MKLRLTKPVLNLGTREPDPRCAEVRLNECYFVGWGYLGGLKKPKRRRFLRVRSEQGLCRYFLWTKPDRGKEYMFVSYFKRKVQLTKEQAEAHFKMKF